jgi:hypothetical protein
VLVAGCGDHHGSHAWISADRYDRVLERVHVLERHPVPRRFLILKDHDPISALDAQSRVSHDFPFPARDP